MRINLSTGQKQARFMAASPSFERLPSSGEKRNDIFTLLDLAWRGRGELPVLVLLKYLLK